MEKLFQLKKNGTTVRTEVIAGLTTFMTMALNPNLLTNFGAEGQDLWNGVFLATCIASAIGSLCMAFLANKPFVMAPGMGLNSFFALVTANIAMMTGMTYLESFRSALVIIFIEGIVFVTLSIFNVREKIVQAIPLGVRLGIGPAIGLMLMNIGFGSNAGVFVFNEDGSSSQFFVMRDFFGALTATSAKDTMGSGHGMMVLTVITMFIGLFTIIALDHKKIKGSVLYGMLVASVFYWAGEGIFFGTNPFESLKTASFVPPFADLASTTLFKIDFAGFAKIGWFTIITLIVTFCIIDMFDTIGTLVGTASRAGMLDKEGNSLRKSIIWCDGRTSEECEEITSIIGYDKLIDITCNPALTGFTASKIRWVMKHEPQIYEKCKKILLPKDYIRFKLTGEFATDVSDASGRALIIFTFLPISSSSSILGSET